MNRCEEPPELLQNVNVYPTALHLKLAKTSRRPYYRPQSLSFAEYRDLVQLTKISDFTELISDEVKDLPDPQLGNTPLHLACGADLSDQVLCQLIPLLVTGNNINHSNLYKQTPLDLLIFTNPHIATEELVPLLCPSDQSLCSRILENIFHVWSGMGISASQLYVITKCLVDHGADLNQKLNGFPLISFYLHRLIKYNSFKHEDGFTFGEDLFVLVAKHTKELFPAFLKVLHDRTKVSYVEEKPLIRNIMKCFLLHMKPFRFKSLSVEIEVENQNLISTISLDYALWMKEDPHYKVNTLSPANQWPVMLNPVTSNVMSRICVGDETSVFYDDFSHDDSVDSSTKEEIEKRLCRLGESCISVKSLQHWCCPVIRQHMSSQREQDYASLGLTAPALGKLTMLDLLDDFCDMFAIYYDSLEDVKKSSIFSDSEDIYSYGVSDCDDSDKQYSDSDSSQENSDHD